MAGLIAPLMFSLITATPGAYARRGGFGGGIADAIAGLDLDPFNKTRFCFGVIFALIAAIQLFQSLRIRFYNNQIHPYFTINTGIPFIIALVLTTSTLVAYYTMFSVLIAIDDNKDTLTPGDNFTNGFYVSIEILPELAEIFFLAGLLIVIRHRAYLNQIAYPRWKDILDGVLMLLLLISFGSQAGVIGAPLPLVISRDEEVVERIVYKRIYIIDAVTHVYVAFYVLTAINIVASAIFMMKKSQRLVAPDKMFRKFAMFVCPWIAIHAAYEVTFDIIYTFPDSATGVRSTTVNYNAVMMSDLIIYGFSFAFAVGAALRVGVHPVLTQKGLPQ